MNKLLIFHLLIAVSLFVSLGSGSNAEAAPINPTATPTPKPLAEIEKLELDKSEVILVCPPIGTIPKEGRLCPDDDGLIKVSTFVNNPKNIPLSYIYTVSGGQITGEGKSRIWNLKGVRPKIYTITVTIKGKRRVSNETKTETITVRECICDPPCICPTLVVSGGGNIKAGETVRFTANLSGGTASDIKYNWTISQGEIVEGQGTSEIIVKTTSKMTGTMEATVEIDGSELCESCPRTASETATIIK